jgi:hypothetical protein
MDTTLQMAVEALLNRTVIEDKVRGFPASEVEGAAVLDTVALTLLLQPRTAYYLYHLARNGLLAEISSEISAAQELRTYLTSVMNPSYAIRDTTLLRKADIALAQIEGQGNLSLASGPYQNFTRATDKFLEKFLSANVRTKGTTEMRIPGDEAIASLTGSLAALKDQHSVVLDRLFSLVVSLQNFSTLDLNTFLGVSASTRIRMGLSSMIDSLATDPSAAKSRDFVNELIAAKAVLRLIGAPPSASDPIVSTVLGLPYGYVLHAKTVEEDTAYLYETDPLVPFSAPQMFVNVGDTLQLGAVTHTVTSIDSVIHFSPISAGWEGDVVVTSNLVIAAQDVQLGATQALTALRGSSFASSLDALDRAIAPLSGQPTVGAVEGARTVLDSLLSLLGTIHSYLSVRGDIFAPVEREAANDVLATLRQRGMGKARDFLLQGKLREVFSMNWQTASYAGAITTAAEMFIQTNVVWPNRALDQGLQTLSREGEE